MKSLTQKDKTKRSLQMTYGFAALELEKAEKLESTIKMALENGDKIDAEILTDYAKVINSYCDALDLMENYKIEQLQYEKVMSLLSKYGEKHPDQLSITMTTYIKYAEVLWSQNKYKQSCRALKVAIAFLLNNIDVLNGDDLNKDFIIKKVLMV